MAHIIRDVDVRRHAGGPSFAFNVVLVSLALASSSRSARRVAKCRGAGDSSHWRGAGLETVQILSSDSQAGRLSLPSLYSITSDPAVLLNARSKSLVSQKFNFAATFS